MCKSLSILATVAVAFSLAACGAGGGDGSAGAGASISVGDPDCPEHPGSGETTMTGNEYELSGAVWCLTNDARAQNNLPPLTWHDRASEVAYAHSMFQREQGDISHDGVDNSSAGDRLTQGGVQWSTWGENVAVGQPSATSVVNAWLRSPGHYANIMGASFTHIGVGTAEGPGGPYNGPWWTQKFFAP